MKNDLAPGKRGNILKSWAKRFGRATVETHHFSDQHDLETWIVDWVGAKLDLRAEDVRKDIPFIELGMDSLMAVELSGRLEEVTGKTISPSAAWEYPTITEIAAHLMSVDPHEENDMDAD